MIQQEIIEEMDNAQVETQKCSDLLDLNFFRENYLNDLKRSGVNPVYLDSLEKKAARSALKGLYRKANQIVYDMDNSEYSSVRAISTVNSFEYADDGIMDAMKEFSDCQEGAKSIVKEMGWDDKHFLMNKFDKIWRGY